MCEPRIKTEVFLNLNISHLELPWCPVNLLPEEASEVIQEVYALHDQGNYFYDMDKIVSVIEQKYRNRPGWWLDRKR